MTNCRVGALAAALFLTITSCCVAAPAIFWASDPVRPDETLVTLGEGIRSDCVVESARLSDGVTVKPVVNPLPSLSKWTVLKPLQVGPRSVKAVLPAAWKPGVFALRVRQADGVSNLLLANAPDPWWLQGDEGQRSTPGGWVRVFGKGLGPSSDEVRAVLRNTQGEDTALKVTKATCWALSAALPATLKSGDYTLFVHNGLGGEAGWRAAGQLTVIPPVTWKTDMFTVAGEGEKVDTDKAIQEAVDKAAANGGGIVFLPRGTYDVKGQLLIPPGTVLRGEGMGLVNLYWANSAEPPAALITGANCGVQDLTIHCFNYIRVISDTPDSERFRLNRVRVRAVPEAVRGRIIKPTKEPFCGLHIQGRNWQVTGCDIYAALACNAQGRALIAGPWGFAGDKGPWYGVMTDNKFFGHMYGCENYKDVIFERNEVQGVCISATTYWNNFSQNLYCADNFIQHVYGGDREIMTFDAGGGAYFGKARAQGAHLTLAADPVFKDYAPTAHTDYRGAAVFILDGTGAGQYRLVTANQGREWEIDRPWIVSPDDTSIISIVPFRGRNLFIGNTFVDGGAVQLYGSSADVILAGNKGTRIDGFFTWGLNPHGWGWQPSFCCQFLDNELTEGSGYGARVWGPSFIGVTTNNSNEQYGGPLARGTLFRRNVMHTQGYIRVEGNTEDTLVEGCTVKHSPTGIRVGTTTRQTLLRKNVFEDVAQPLDGDGPKNAVIVDIKKE